jgi:hypothetical protein
MEDEPERGSPLSADDALQEFMSAIDQFPEKMLAKQLAVRGDDMLVSFFDRHKHDMPESLEGSFSTSLRRLTRNTDILEDQGLSTQTAVRYKTLVDCTPRWFQSSTGY